MKNKESDETDYVRLVTVDDFLDVEAVSNSHAGDELRSVLQPVYKYFNEIPNSELTVGAPQGEQEEAFYPRIKCLKNGAFIMFYMGGQHGSRIWCRTSMDFINWTEPLMLLEPQKISVTESSGAVAQDWRRFANMDAVVLPEGEIIAVCSYRAGSHYSQGIDCGIIEIRSLDNGKTWSSPRVIYEGPNWEPYILRLPDGTLHCYFTDPIPQTRNSGTSLIVSEDDGNTWGGKKIVCRQFKYEYKTLSDDYVQYNGQRIYTDQMPVFRVLNDGKTIFGFMEARLESPAPEDCALDKYSSHYMMSLVWNDGFIWMPPEGDEDLPARRETNICKGSGGYVETFPSGEIVISAAIGSLFMMKIGNMSATEWQGGISGDCGWLKGFDQNGFWGCMERYGDNALLASMKGPACLQTGMFYLNNRVDVHEKMHVGGDDQEWENVAEGLYISSKESKNGAFFRFCHSSDTLFVRIDREDPMSGENNQLELLFAVGNGPTTSVCLLPSGVIAAPKEVEAVCRKAKTSRNGKGYVYEVSIPYSCLGDLRNNDYINFYADMKEGGVSNCFTFSDMNRKETWQCLKIIE